MHEHHHDSETVMVTREWTEKVSPTNTLQILLAGATNTATPTATNSKANNGRQLSVLIG